MRTLVVVNQPGDWRLDVPGVQVISARQYLTGAAFPPGRGTVVYNLCRSYRYQSTGYYVSLLAAARGHRPLPSLSTIQDLKTTAILRLADEDLEDVIQRSLQDLHSSQFTLSIYFGRNVAKRYDTLSRSLFRLFDAPLLRAEFEKEDKWHLARVVAIGAKEIPEDHWPFVTQRAQAFFSKPRFRTSRRQVPRYSLALLVNPEEAMPPSDEGALRKFERAARRVGLEPIRIEREDYGRLGEYDALFIRETTSVNHHTYRFSRRAVAEDLVAIDDPLSILRCTNKVYLAELLARHHIGIPRTIIAHRDNYRDLGRMIGYPLILKQPDSSFSQGVVKVNSDYELVEEAEALLDRSDLIIAQEFLPTAFDWRVGILDRKPLFVCRYHMAPKHWQILKTETSGRVRYGEADTLAVEAAPRQVVRTALKAANLIGDGLYGVDLKQIGRKCCVIEVNDNPSIEAGVEDRVLKDGLYDTIMGVFLKRIEQLREGRGHL
jgi:glutathione synthase/RimK-type ligase-like ATP-grasp enzyme